MTEFCSNITTTFLTLAVRVQVMMQDPVIAADGHSYERDAMTTWLQHHHTSPVTGQLLKHTRLISNLAVKCMIGA